MLWSFRAWRDPRFGEWECGIVLDSMEKYNHFGFRIWPSLFVRGGRREMMGFLCWSVLMLYGYLGLRAMQHLTVMPNAAATIARI